MAPRSAKVKKTADVKVVENEAPKKGRGKTKNIEEPELELPAPETNDNMVQVSDKKKRGKKVETNGQDDTNGAAEDAAPLAKKGRKKNNIDNSDEKIDNKAHEESPAPEEAQENGEDIDLEPQGNKGRKKLAKKEFAQEKPKEASKGKKNTKQTKMDVDVEKEESIDEKPKPTGKRGRKGQTKSEAEGEYEKKAEDTQEEAKEEPPASKGRKKGGKPAKEYTTDGDKEEVQEDLDEKLEVKKNDPKGKKNQNKKSAAKEETEAEEGKDDGKNAKKRKNAKKEKAKGDSKDEEAMEDDSVEPKAKGKRIQKKTIESVENEEVNEGESASKRRRKPAEEKGTDATKKPPPKNKAATDYENIDFTNNSKNSKEKDWNFKISSWNVDGIRAWLNKGGMDYIKYEKPNILCLQEIKCSQEKLPNEVVNVPGYHTYWLSGDIDGYAGVGIFTTKLAMNVQYGLGNPELDSEGRIITAEYEPFYLICTYVPNAGRKLVTLPKRLQWNEEFRKYVKDLDKKKPVIICGDMNVAHNEIDLKNPKTNRKNAGFTEEERQGMSELLADGFVDTYRRLYPDVTEAYTFWTYMMNSRAKNVGWRLDYFLVSERLLPSLCDSVIRDQVYGSDHCPITLLMHLTSAEKPKE